MSLGLQDALKEIGIDLNGVGANDVARRSIDAGQLNGGISLARWVNDIWIEAERGRVKTIRTGHRQLVLGHLRLYS